VNNSVKGAGRVVFVLSLLKWMFVAWSLFGGLLAGQLVWTATDWPTYTLWGVALAAVVSALLWWALLGWAQHVLGMLVLGNESGRGLAVMLKGGGAGTAAYPGEPGSVTFAPGGRVGRGGNGGSATIVGDGGSATGGSGGRS
jgi:hypothetical protein